MCKKMLVLGSDYGVVEIVKEAQRIGLYVIVADYYSTTPAKEIADEAWFISTNELDILEKKCRDNSVEAIIAGANDFNVDNLRKLCKRLNLPMYCSNDTAWEIANNKYEFKKLCRQVGAPVAKDYYTERIFNGSELNGIEYPVVVKPVDKAGNRGMSYCANEKELLKACEYARSISDNEKLIIERELHGPEFAVNYIIANGEPRLLFFSSEHNQPGEPENLYSIIITTSCHLKQYIKEVNDKVISVFKEAGCTEGVAWVECIRDTDGNFYLLEMGYRFGGEAVNIPYENVCGFNSVKWMIETACGAEHTVNDLPAGLTAMSDAYKAIAASYLLFSNREAVIGKIYGLDEISKIPGVLVDVNKNAGFKVAYHLTLGVIRIFAEDCEQLCEKLTLINSLLRVEDENGENMIIYFDNIEELKNEYAEGIKEFQN